MALEEDPLSRGASARTPSHKDSQHRRRNSRIQQHKSHTRIETGDGWLMVGSHAEQR
eukprot:CAMPEP_0119382492 /NCGR_PEP_ID=MMETSP1334-20130426/72878_1 /TAXON_ID=127549 /ORGANISM="Calcidiscus leptoporus, Strain RCC1130" /LENGTH=56 /DNA_ID=CAMNT_0007402983 /DNA_START=56 /DNA_END=222 /DNA_ORIENTATION=-